MQLPAFLAWVDGEIRLVGHRIALMHVVDLYNEGHTPEMIVFEFDTLSLHQIRNVIDFYESNKAEVDAYVARCRAEIDQQIAEHVPSAGIVRLRRLMQLLKDADAKRASDPRWWSLSLIEKVRQLEQEAGASMNCGKTSNDSAA